MGNSKSTQLPHKRLFIGIKIPFDKRAKTLTETIHNDLKDCKVRWTKPSNYHLTLRFLGNTPISLINTISQLLSEISSKRKAFHLKIESVGYFNPGNPKIVWFGIQANDELKKLTDDISHALALIGFEFNNSPNHPHVTLGRIKNIDPLFQINNYIERYKELGVMDVDVSEVCLFESRTKHDGPEYTILQSYELI